MSDLAYIELNVFAMIILLLLVKCRRGGLDREQRYFNRVLTSNALVLLFDALIMLCKRFDFPGARECEIASTYLYYIMNAVVPFTWLLYVDLKIYYDVRGLKKRIKIYGIPFFTSMVLIGANAFTDNYFFGINAQKEYMRGAGFIYVTIMALIPAFTAEIMSLRASIRCRVPSLRREYAYLTRFMLFPLAGFALQFAFYGLQLVWVFSVISLTMIYINVQNRQIYTDELTGLNNRKFMIRAFPGIVDQRRRDSRVFAVMIDIDRFKYINDTFGHLAGDMALIRAAAVLSSACEVHGDTLARMGGDEFVILGLRDASEGLTIISDIEKRLNASNAKAEGGISISLSCGIARLGENGAKDLDTLLSAADKAMYIVKSSKKGCSRN